MLNKIVVRGLIGISTILAFSTQAAPLPSCDTSNMTLTDITNVGETQSEANDLLSSDPYDATHCRLYSGNDDQGGASTPAPNLGWENDGFLNGQGFDPVENGFIAEEDLMELDGDGFVDDPGYIHLANFGGDVVDGKLQLNYYSNVGEGATIANVGDFLTIEFNCDANEDNECKTGTWSLELSEDPSVIEDIQAALGRPSIFDQLVFSMKAGSGKQEDTGTAIYAFDFDEIFAIENDPENLNFTTPYNFYGTFNTAGLGGKGISHLNVWARDPLLAQVNAPATAGLLMLSFFAMRRKLKK